MARKIPEITLRESILEILSELGEATVGSFFPKKYPVGRFWRRVAGNRGERPSPRTFSSILSQLRADGLVERNGPNKSSVWRITQPGSRYLRGLNKQRREALERLPKRDGLRRLVIFDIPEQEKEKRQALRRELITIGYTQLQKSVWSGDFPLPEEFLEFLDVLELENHVHIFSVHSEGTLRKR